MRRQTRKNYDPRGRLSVFIVVVFSLFATLTAIAQTIGGNGGNGGSFQCINCIILGNPSTGSGGNGGNASGSLRPQGSQVEMPETYQVDDDVSDGILNIRSGPGLDHEVVASIPEGEKGVIIGRCRVSDDDGRSRRPWCQASWQGNSGWVSSCCVSGASTGRRPQ